MTRKTLIFTFLIVMLSLTSGCLVKEVTRIADKQVLKNIVRNDFSNAWSVSYADAMADLWSYPSIWEADKLQNKQEAVTYFKTLFAENPVDSVTLDVTSKDIAFSGDKAQVIVRGLIRYKNEGEAEVAFKLYFKKEQTSKDWKIEAKETIT